MANNLSAPINEGDYYRPLPPVRHESAVPTEEGKSLSLMSDKQFNSIIEMVIQILNRSTDLEDAKKALTAIKR